MSDEIDRANDEAQFTTDHAVQTYLKSQALPPQRIVADAVLCLDCESVIPPGRLAALPNCVRCIGCQEAEELRGRVI